MCKINLHDKPINDIDDDYFNIEKRVVEKIYGLIQDSAFFPLTIAITGEWGTGKTSAINLLSKKLAVNKKNILIHFEPLLEGKLEIIDIVQLFYLKLYKALKYDKSKFKKTIEKTIKSIAMLSRGKITINSPMSFVTAEIDLEKNINDIMDIWEKDDIKSFSDQTAELNEMLRDYKIYIFIDEIDRLQSSQILNFLMFLRILEKFDNLVCIIGLDYKQVINKLIAEGELGLSNYESAKSYLDKIFQAKFPIYHPLGKKIKFVSEILSKKEFISEIIEVRSYEEQKLMTDIIEYLSTPRQIKKWIVSIRLHLPFVKNFPKKLNFIGFLAVSIKHPVLLENISKYTLPILFRRNSSLETSPILFKKNSPLELFLKDRYNVDIPELDDEEKNQIILLSTGLKKINLEDPSLEEIYKRVYKELDSYFIDDSLAARLIGDFLFESPVHLIFLLVSGYIDEKNLTLYNDFFNEKIDNTLEKLKHDDQETDILACDLLEAIRNITIASDIKPSLAILNEIWAAKEYYGASYIDNPYCHIVLFALENHDAEEIISQAHITISFIYIEKRLLTFNITRENGKYDFESFNNPKGNNDSDHVTLNNEKINKDSIKKILQQWIKKFESELESINFFKLRRDRLIHIMCRYLEWGKSMGLDNRVKLSNCIKSFLENVYVSDGEKKAIIEIIIDECRKYSEWGHGEKRESPIQLLFDKNLELIKCINEFSDKIGGIKNIDYFRN